MADGFEQSELLEPRQALDEAGAQTQVVSPIDGKVKGWNDTDWGDEVPNLGLRSKLTFARPEEHQSRPITGW